MTTTNDNSTNHSSKGLRQIDIFAAPECEPDILAVAPRIFNDAAGRECLEWLGGEPAAEGETDTYRIIKQLVFPGIPVHFVLVQLSAAKAIFITPPPERHTWTNDELKAEDLSIAAEGLIYAALQSQVDGRLSKAAQTLWDGGNKIEQESEPALHRLGQVMALDAILADPMTAHDMISRVRHQLVEATPALALMTKSTLIEYTGQSEVQDGD